MDSRKDESPQVIPKAPVDDISPDAVPNSKKQLTNADLYQPVSDFTAIPVDTSFSNEAHEFFNGSTISPAVNQKPFVPEAGFGKSISQGFQAVNDLSLMYNYQNSNFGSDNPLDDPVPADWDIKEAAKQYSNIDSKYAGYMLDANGPKDLQRRYYNVLDRMYNDSLYEKGSMWGHAAGMIAGGILSPTSWIPLGIEAKSARLSVRLAQDIPKIIPGIAVASVTHEAIAQTNDIAGNLEDFAINSFRDTIFGTAFMGTAMGIGHGYTAGKIWDTRRTVNILYNDIELIPQIKPDSSFSHLKAVGTDGSVSAAKVDNAQQFANSQMAKDGMFAIPILGGWLGKGSELINPIVRGLNSHYQVMRGYVDRAGDHGIATEGTNAGIASPEKFEVKMANLNGENKQLMWWLHGLHLERNGLDSAKRVRSGIAETKMKMTKDEAYVSPNDFMGEIEGVIINDVPSKHSTVNEAAAAMILKMDESYKRYREAFDLPESWLPPKTARGYLSRVYDLDKMLTHQKEFVDVVSAYLKTADEEIESYMKPVRDLKEAYLAAKESHLDYIKDKSLSEDQIETSVKAIKALKKKHLDEEARVQDRIRSDESLRIHAEDIMALSSTESKKLIKILKPLNAAKRGVKTEQTVLDGVNFDIVKTKGSLAESKNREAIDSLTARLQELNDKVPELEENIRVAKESRDTEYLKLQDSARDGKIDRIYYENDKGAIKFKDPKDKLKFRKIYESDAHRTKSAASYHASIMNHTAEQTNVQVLSALLGRKGESPLKKRSLLVPDHILYEGDFLSKNLGVNVANYRNLLGRRTFMKEVYGDITMDGGQEGIVEQLRQEYLGNVDTINRHLDHAKRKGTEKDVKKWEKALRKENKLFASTKDDMSHFHKKMMGEASGTQKQREFTSILRNFAVSIKLGAVPLTQISDMMAIPMKHGIWPTIKHGLMPMLRNIKNLIASGKGEKYVKYAPHAHLGLNQTLMAHQERTWAGSAQPYTPMYGKLVNGMESLAHMSQNFAGTNQVDNVLQETIAGIYQSEVMEWMHDFKAGKLKPRDKQKLLIYGIQPEKWADRFINGWKEAGSDGNGFGGFNSRFWEWSDNEALLKMQESIQRSVRDTVIRGGMFDSPFALDNPYIGTMFMFKRWVMGSMTRYTIPLMQKPDSEKLVGAMLMFAAGTMVTPLRRIARGQDPIQDEDNMVLNGLIDGGALTLPMDFIETANVLMGGSLMKDIKNDRYRQRSVAGLVAGPMGSIGDDIGHVIMMVAKGQANQQDLNRFARLIPLLQSWQLRGFSNKMVESTGLPETAAQASKQ